MYLADFTVINLISYIMKLLSKVSGIIKKTDVLIAREKKDATVQIVYKFDDIFILSTITKHEYGSRDSYSLALLLSSKLRNHFNTQFSL